MRKFIFISTGIIFLLIAVVLIITGTEEKDNILMIFLSASVPFTFTAYWNFFNIYFETRIGTVDEYFTYSGTGKRGIGAFYNKAVIVPVFICLFSSAAAAIVTAFLAVNRSTEDISYMLPPFSFLVCLIITIYYSGKMFKALRPSVDKQQAENINDDAGFKIAFFFASVATLGLFPLGYFIYKRVTKKSL